MRGEGKTTPKRRKVSLTLFLAVVVSAACPSLGVCYRVFDQPFVHIHQDRHPLCIGDRDDRHGQSFRHAQPAADRSRAARGRTAGQQYPGCVGCPADFGYLGSEADTLKAGKAVLDGDTELVDRITMLTGAGATVFNGGLRSPVRPKRRTANGRWARACHRPHHRYGAETGQPFRARRISGQPIWAPRSDPRRRWPGDRRACRGAQGRLPQPMLDVLVRGGLALGGLAALIVAAASFIAMRCCWRR